MEMIYVAAAIMMGLGGMDAAIGASTRVGAKATGHVFFRSGSGRRDPHYWRGYRHVPDFCGRGLNSPHHGQGRKTCSGHRRSNE